MPLHLDSLPFVFQQTPNDSVTLESVGLISGLPMRATIRLAPQGSGVTFILPNGERLPADDRFVANSQRGITMQAPESNATLSIVEHCLAAVSLSGQHDLEISVETGTDLSTALRFGRDDTFSYEGGGTCSPSRAKAFTQAVGRRGLSERHLCKREVGGSSPPRSTI